MAAQPPERHQLDQSIGARERRRVKGRGGRVVPSLAPSMYLAAAGAGSEAPRGALATDA